MIRVGVLRGGTGYQYERSIASGAYILKHLPRDTYEPVDIFIDREGSWHLGGAPVSSEKLKHRIDIIWNALHGYYGSDGKVQQALELLGIPYTGSGPLPSALSHNQKLANERVSKLGIKTPRGIYVEDWGTNPSVDSVLQVVSHAALKLSPPWIVKPISRGQAGGGMKCATRDELASAVAHMSDHRIPVVIEEAVLGREVCVLCAPGFRRQEGYTFIPIEKKNPQKRILKIESEALQKIAKKVHHDLGLGQYSEMKVLIDKRGEIHFIEIESQPDLSENSPFNQSLSVVGSSFDEFARHVLNTAIKS